MTWLLVEDDPDIRNVVSLMFTVWGERPLVFPDGNAAWTWLDSVEQGTFQGELPNFALMDIRMPGYTGDKIASRIRTTQPLKHIPVVLMTAFSLTENEIKTMMQQTGIDHLINKPLPDMDIFRNTLYAVRDRRAQMMKLVANQAAKVETTAAPQQPPSPSNPSHAGGH